jgi:predicted membrane-bound mannosyltransferase
VVSVVLAYQSFTKAAGNSAYTPMLQKVRFFVALIAVLFLALAVSDPLARYLVFAIGLLLATVAFLSRRRILRGK